MLNKAISFIPGFREMGLVSLKVVDDPFPDALAEETHELEVRLKTQASCFRVPNA